MNKYTLTSHALQRFFERVGRGKNKAHAENWINQAMSEAQYVGGQDDGRKFYRYKDFKIVISPPNTVVTITYFKGIALYDSELDMEIQELIARRVKKTIKPLMKEREANRLSYFEAEIKKIRARNPKTKAIIQEEIEIFKSKVEENSLDIEKVLSTANKYDVPVEKIIKGGTYD